MVQYLDNHLDLSFAALSDATRRGIIDQLTQADASITGPHPVAVLIHGGPVRRQSAPKRVEIKRA